SAESPEGALWCIRARFSWVPRSRLRHGELPKSTALAACDSGSGFPPERRGSENSDLCRLDNHRQKRIGREFFHWRGRGLAKGDVMNLGSSLRWLAAFAA